MLGQLLASHSFTGSYSHQLRTCVGSDLDTKHLGEFYIAVPCRAGISLVLIFRAPAAMYTQVQVIKEIFQFTKKIIKLYPQGLRFK